MRDDNVNSTQMPIIWEKPHGDNWVNVLFIDGHVGGFPGTIKTNVDIVNVLKKRMGLSDQQFKYYLRKAKWLDGAIGLKVDKLPKETVKALDALVAQLGADDFKTRKKAQTELKKHLPKAYQYLQKKLKESKDPEVKTRLKKLLGMAGWSPKSSPTAKTSADIDRADFFDGRKQKR